MTLKKGQLIEKFEAESFPKLIRDIIKWAVINKFLTEDKLPITTSGGKYWLSKTQKNIASRAKEEIFPKLGKVFISYGANKNMAEDRLKRLLNTLGFEYKIQYL